MIAKQRTVSTKTVEHTANEVAGGNASVVSTVHDRSTLLEQKEQFDEQERLVALVYGDFMPTSDEEAQAALEEMRGDTTMHLTSPVLDLVLKGQTLEHFQVVASMLLPHLSRCNWCRSSLHTLLKVAEVSDEHPAYALLEDAEDGALWDAAGRNAAEAAYARLQSQGIGHVYGRDGVVYRRRPDGGEERLQGGSGQTTACEQIAK